MDRKAMHSLNYNHLYYFWVVAREGSVVKAADELLVSQPTVSHQLKQLEREMGQQLFERAGRKLALTPAGRVAFNYANEMFSLGQELVDALEHQPGDRPLKLSVGLVDVIPKTVAHLLLEPARHLPQAVRLVCREDKADRLLTDLAARRVDVVLSDGPIGHDAHLRGFNHLLGESGVSFVAVKKLATRYKRGFPKSLNGAPVLLPSDHTALRRSLNLWLNAQRIHPLIVGEFDDAAMLNAFGRGGAGVFPVPSVVEDEICHLYDTAVVGRTTAVRERYYAISVEEKIKHPAVVAICEAARRDIFSHRSGSQLQRE